MLLSTLALALAPLTLAGPIAKRQSFGGRATFYDVGLGACGGYNVASDFIVALNAPQYGGGYPGPQCGKSITISYGGKSAQATIADLCPGCGYGDLDMSRGLFNYFADESAGVFQMSWSFNGGGGGQQQQQAQPGPEPTPEPTTSTWTPPPSTQAPTPEPTTSSETPEPSPSAASTSSSSFSASASASASAVASASASASMAPLAIDTAPQASLGNLILLNQIVTNYGGVILAAAGSPL